MVTINSRVADLETDMKTLKADMDLIKSGMGDIKDCVASFEDMSKTVDKIWKAAKYVTGATLPTLIAAGYVNGTFGEILSKLFGIGT